MGYTHYFETDLKGIPTEQWSAICRDIKTLIKHLPEHSTNAGGYHSADPLKIAYEDDQPTKPPAITKTLIRFNGTGGDDLGHETFVLERKPKQSDWRKGKPKAFAFCKTARKPYDLVVCAALIVAVTHANELLDVSSDGDYPEDWQPAVDWVRSVLGANYTDVWDASRIRVRIERATGAHV